MHKLTFFPLDNADCCLIDLDNGQKLLFDYAAKRKENDDSDLRIDLPAKLREDLETVDKDEYDVVAFTHADDDHIHGFSEFFYLEYAQKYQDEDRIKIQTLWVPAAVILEPNLEDEAKILRDEARHRLIEGKGIRVFSEPELLDDWLNEQRINPEDRKHLITHAGEIIPGFDLSSEDVEFFVHSPFSNSIDDEIVRNDAAFVVQARLQIGNQNTQVILGADLTHTVWTDIVRISRHFDREDSLQWDVFKVSHHCSYTALSDEKGEDKTTPVDDVAWLFEQGCQGGILVSSSKPIPSNDDSNQPPHRQAANYYIVTMQHPNESAPEPLVIIIDDQGATLRKQSAGVIGLTTRRRAPRAG
jgi:hypothetical protein